LLFIAYIVIVLYLTTFGRKTVFSERRLSLVLFDDLIRIYRVGRFDLFIRLFFGNIAWFVPFGFLFPLIASKSGFLRTVCFCFIFSLAIEVTQYIFYIGVADVDDLLLNTIGGAAGRALFSLFTAAVKKIRA